MSWPASPHDAVIRVYDAAGDVIETHEHAGDFKVREQKLLCVGEPNDGQAQSESSIACFIRRNILPIQTRRVAQERNARQGDLRLGSNKNMSVMTDNGIPMTAEQELDELRRALKNARAYSVRGERPPHVPANRNNAWTRVIWLFLQEIKHETYRLDPGEGDS